MQHEKNYISDVVKYDIQSYSRDNAVIVGTSATVDTLPVGTVLGKKSDGNYVQLDPTASTGEQLAAGVLLYECQVSDTVAAESVVLSRHAIVSGATLVWDVAVTEPQKQVAIDELAAAGIISRVGA